MDGAPHIEVEYLADLKIIEVRTCGVLPGSSWPDVIRAAADEGGRSTCILYLIDHRRARFRFRFSDLMRLPKIVGSLALPPDARVGVLAPDGLERNGGFVETLMSNRGINLRIFRDRDKAVAWLLDQAKPNPLGFPGPT